MICKQLPETKRHGTLSPTDSAEDVSVRRLQIDPLRPWLDDFPDPVLIANHQRSLIYWNNAARHLLGDVRDAVDLTTHGVAPLASATYSDIPCFIDQ